MTLHFAPFADALPCSPWRSPRWPFPPTPSRARAVRVRTASGTVRRASPGIVRARGSTQSHPRGALTEARETHRQAMRDLREQHQERPDEILSDEQREALREARREMRDESGAASAANHAAAPDRTGRRLAQRAERDELTELRESLYADMVDLRDRSSTPRGTPRGVAGTARRPPCRPERMFPDEHAEMPTMWLWAGKPGYASTITVNAATATNAEPAPHYMTTAPGRKFIWRIPRVVTVRQRSP
ncbi:hypothetical protein DSL92_01880 [Billgrantia gudaonensis]|uniref:Uncharacterized protein n=1 Tax=Billgrantia gudaonensis TaxID=376427 RepID=A0A3S0NXE0_9GAMM|nr:hypothetical protein DSL92_01880 [Halomonas gudaonensis]